MKTKNLKTKNSSSDLYDFADSIAKSFKVGAENHISLRRYIFEKMENLKLARDPFGPIRNQANLLAMKVRS